VAERGARGRQLVVGQDPDTALRGEEVAGRPGLERP
jgi:hypothetical protein